MCTHSSVRGLNLHISNLTVDVTEIDILQLFGPYGQIDSVRVMRQPSGSSRGFGFAHFCDAAAANTAMQALHGTFVKGQIMFVSVARTAVPGSRAVPCPPPATSPPPSTSPSSCNTPTNKIISSLRGPCATPPALPTASPRHIAPSAGLHHPATNIYYTANPLSLAAPTAMFVLPPNPHTAVAPVQAQPYYELLSLTVPVPQPQMNSMRRSAQAQIPVTPLAAAPAVYYSPEQPPIQGGQYFYLYQQYF
jgi:RNA recognition motif-containing protein